MLQDSHEKTRGAQRSPPLAAGCGLGGWSCLGQQRQGEACAAGQAARPFVDAALIARAVAAARAHGAAAPGVPLNDTVKEIDAQGRPLLLPGQTPDEKGEFTCPDALGLATPMAVIAGITYNFLPFMTLPLYASLDRIDPRLIEAAADLYARPFTGFRKVTFPLSMPGVVGGTLLTFIPAAGDYINAQLLGSPKDKMIGNVIESQFIRIRDYPVAASMSFVLLVTILVLVTVYIRRAGTEELL